MRDEKANCGISSKEISNIFQGIRKISDEDEEQIDEDEHLPYHHMEDALPWSPLEDVVCRAAVPEHASFLTSRSKLRSPNLSVHCEVVTDLLNVALTTALLCLNRVDPREWQN